MKHKILAPVLIATLVLSGSCALQKEQSKRVASHKDSPEFLNDVVIDNGSNAVNLYKGKSIYHLEEKEGKHHLSDEKITIDQLVKTSDTGLANFIKEWMGVPYQLGGLTKQGIDCSAFTRALYASVYHITLLRTAFEQFSASIPIYDQDSLQEGDLVFFKIHSRVISHVGVYLSDGYFVQASSHGVMISNLDEHYWKRFYFAGGRVKS
ncbi:MAG TPA: C40 family peptidase [Edaphocola sp.]|nr:C40 family peptidase [Edaphocola sp.]